MRSVRWSLSASLVFVCCLTFIPVGIVHVAAQEWDQTFNPYTGKWEDVNLPAAAPSLPNTGQDPRGSKDPAETVITILKKENVPTKPASVPEVDVTSKDAALQILQHKEDEAAKWMYEQPMCPSMHYHKPLKGNDVCANPLGDDAAVSCPAGTSLVTDHHPAGSDACRSRRSF